MSAVPAPVYARGQCCFCPKIDVVSVSLVSSVAPLEWVVSPLKNSRFLEARSAATRWALHATMRGLLENRILRKIKMPGGHFRKLGGQLGPALVAAAAQHGAAGFAGHPLHETVFMRAVALLWLVRSFWHMRLLYKKAAQRANGVVLTIQIRRCTQTYPHQSQDIHTSLSVAKTVHNFTSGKAEVNKTCSNFCIDLWKSRLGMAILELKKPRGTSGNSRPRQAVEDSDGRARNRDFWRCVCRCL